MELAWRGWTDSMFPESIEQMFAIMKLSDRNCNFGEEGISTLVMTTYTHHQLKLRLPGSKQKVQPSSLLSLAKRVCCDTLL